MILSDYIIKGMGLFRNYGYDKQPLPDPVRWGNSRQVKDGEFYLSWGDSIPSIPSERQAIMESGFFIDSAHIDRRGLYQNSTLCDPEVVELVDKFEAPAPAREKIQAENSSKFPQGQDPEFQKSDILWTGVVLACQNPDDRSIRSVSTAEKYYQFLDDACQFYKGNLFLKLHPWNSGEKGERIRNIAKKHGCRSGKVDHRIIKNCQFVLLFNSTYSVDCFLRGVPVAQYAPGYFWRFPCVSYTAGSFPLAAKTHIEYGYKLCDFLLWRYCFHAGMGVDAFLAMVRRFENPDELFPMTLEQSYGHYITHA